MAEDKDSKDGNEGVQPEGGTNALTETKKLNEEKLADISEDVKEKNGEEAMHLANAKKAVVLGQALETTPLILTQNSSLSKVPTELWNMVFDRALSGKLPIIDPLPPFDGGLAEKPGFCPRPLTHVSFQPGSANERPLTHERMEILSYFLNPRSVRRPGWYAANAFPAQILQACHKFNNIGKDMLFEKATLLLTSTHAVECFVRSYPREVKMIQNLVVIAQVNLVILCTPDPLRFQGRLPEDKRVMSRPDVFSVDLAPFEGLKSLQVHFSSNYGFPFDNPNLFGELQGFDIPYWLNATGWKVDKVKISGLEYVVHYDATILSEFEEILLTEVGKAQKLKAAKKNENISISETKLDGDILRRNDKLRGQLSDGRWRDRIATGPGRWQAFVTHHAPTGSAVPVHPRDTEAARKATEEASKGAFKDTKNDSG